MSTFGYTHVSMTAIAAMNVRPLGRSLKALADETRLRIVALLSHGELCVCHLESALELSQPTVSRQMAVLRAAGLVESRRQGTWVFYRLAQPADSFSQAQLKALVASFGKKVELRRDVARLLRSRGPGACR